MITAIANTGMLTGVCPVNSIVARSAKRGARWAVARKAAPPMTAHASTGVSPMLPWRTVVLSMVGCVVPLRRIPTVDTVDMIAIMPMPPKAVTITPREKLGVRMPPIAPLPRHTQVTTVLRTHSCASARHVSVPLKVDMVAYFPLPATSGTNTTTTPVTANPIGMRYRTRASWVAQC